jgi:hypothetical protein
MPNEQIGPRDFGRMEGKLDSMHEIVEDIRDNGCGVSKINRERINWVWASLCGLAVAFGGGFLFLYTLLP